MDNINLNTCALVLISDDDSLHRYAISVHDSLTVRGKSSFLHTEPHHDDIMLEFVHVVLIATQATFESKHHCLRAKSGFNSVSNPHMLELLERCVKFIICGTLHSLTRPGGQMTDRCPDHDGVWTIVVVTFETHNSSVLLPFGPPVWGPWKPLSLRRNQLWEPWKIMFADAARLERASGALSTLQPDSLPLAGRCRRQKTAVLDKLPMSYKKEHTPQPHAQTRTCHSLDDDAFGHLKKVIVTSAVHPRMFELDQDQVEITVCSHHLRQPQCIVFGFHLSELIVHCTKKLREVFLSIKFHQT